MKTKEQIQKEIKRLKDKINLAKETGKGYCNFSELRRDSGRIDNLRWVLK